MFQTSLSNETSMLAPQTEADWARESASAAFDRSEVLNVSDRYEFTFEPELNFAPYATTVVVANCSAARFSPTKDPKFS